MGGRRGGGGAPAYTPPPPPVYSSLVSGGIDEGSMAVMPSMSAPQISQSQPTMMSQEGGNPQQMPTGGISMTPTKTNPYASGRRPGAGAAASAANKQTGTANQFTIPSLSGVTLGG